MADASLFFRDLAYIFTAAVVGGMVARRLSQPLILGYVAGGILISPFTPGPSVSNVHGIELFAEIGVILLMFSIGIEFSLRDLLKAKWVALIGGPLGIVASMAVGVAISVPFGWSLTQGMVIGTVVSVASTMVLARLLMDRGELRSEHGRVMIGITLVEDLAVVVLTVLLPTLGSLQPERLWDVALAMGKAALVLVPAGIAAARIVPALLGRVLSFHSQELFLVVILALCLGTAALTQAVGLSLALGAFVAGLVVSGSDYAREALGSFLPLRDAFVALFFVSIGMLIDPASLGSNLPLLAALVALIIFGKAMIWTFVVRSFHYSIWTAALVGLGLTQIGEFSFVLVQVARTAGLVGADVYNATLAASLITILLNAAVVKYGSAWISRRRISQAGAASVERTEAGLSDHVVICGFGRLGGPAGTAFDAFSCPYVVVEIDPDTVKAARQKNIRCIYGDPAHRPVLEAAHVEHAALVIVTLPEADRALLAIRNVRTLNRNVPILARAHRRTDYQALLNAGATRVVQPEVEASATLIGHALEFLGAPHEKVAGYVAQYREAMEIARSGPLGGPNPMPELQQVPAETIATIGTTLKTSGIRERYGLTVLGVQRASGERLFNPSADTVLLPGDQLQVLGLPAQLEQLTTPPTRPQE
jgi:monovalent cation:H+ antiporter-2, CPA2 family